jgi:hypothetical protein
LPRTRLRGHNATTSPVLWQRLYPSLINLNGDRPLQERYRQYKALMPSETQQNSLYATERAILDSHPLPNLQEGPRLAGEPGLGGSLDSDNFAFVNGDGSSANSHHMNNPRDRKNWEPIQWVKLAKHVPGEEWKFDFIEPVRPPASAFVQGQQQFVAPPLQVCGNLFFVSTSNPQRVPRIIYISRFHTRPQMALESPMRALSNLKATTLPPFESHLLGPIFGKQYCKSLRSSRIVRYDSRHPGQGAIQSLPEFMQG